MIDEDGEEAEPEHPASARMNGISQNAVPAPWERCDFVIILLINIPNDSDAQTDDGARISLLENLNHAENWAQAQYGSQIPKRQSSAGS